MPFLFALTLGLLFTHTVSADQLAPVATVLASKQAIQQELMVTGTVTSAQRAQLSLSTSGLIENLLVDAGDQVQQGEPLLSLDADLVQQRVNAANATADRAQLASQDAKRRLQEAQRLLTQKGIAESAVKDLQAEVIQDEADLRAAQAEQQYQQGILQRHQLTAPFTGVISRKLVEVGEWVTPGTAVLELVNTQRLRLDFYIPDNYLQRLQPGTSLTYTLASRPDDDFAATVSSIVPVADPGARTFLLRARPMQQNPNLNPGQAVTAFIAIETGRQNVVVPRDAVLKLPDGRSTVWSIARNNNQWIAQEHVVQLGLSFAGQFEVLSGLPSNTQVVVQGNEALQIGQPVRLISSAEE